MKTFSKHQILLMPYHSQHLKLERLKTTGKKVVKELEEPTKIIKAIESKEAANYKVQWRIARGL